MHGNASGLAGAALALGMAAATFGCRGEAERRARHIAELRRDAVAGLDAAHRFCAARDSAVNAFERGEPGWERALEDVLRATPALDDYCEDLKQPHEHDAGAPAAPAAVRPDSAAS